MMTRARYRESGRVRQKSGGLSSGFWSEKTCKFPGISGRPSRESAKTPKVDKAKVTLAINKVDYNELPATGRNLTEMRIGTCKFFLNKFCPFVILLGEGWL
jgi:hypothetical protein